MPSTLYMESEKMETDKKWYVIHTYSGYENKVKANLERKVHSMGMENEIFDIVVPVDDETEIKDGKRKTIKRKVFPGYVLVQMIVNESSWYAVRNTPGVTGFVGSDSTKPLPLADSEVRRILKLEKPSDKPRVRPNVSVEVGEAVRITEGAFESIPGTVVDIDYERGKIKVLVEMFGKETPVEVNGDQVEKI